MMCIRVSRQSKTHRDISNEPPKKPLWSPGCPRRTPLEPLNHEITKTNNERSVSQMDLRTAKEHSILRMNFCKAKNKLAGAPS